MEGRPISNLIHLIAWLTGVLVSLAVGFGMKDGILAIPGIGILTVYAGWVVIVLTITSVLLAIANRF